MKKRHVMRALVAAATALALTACGSTGSSDTSKSTSTASAASTSSGSEAGTENTITIPAGESVSQDSDVTAMVAVDFTTMDPMDTSDTLSGGVQRMMMDGLFGFDENMQIIPMLATSYEANDEATEYTIHLREGVSFTDGTPWNADALIANVNKWADKSLGLKRTTFLCNVLDHAEKVDDYTVKIYLSQSFGAFISNLAHPATLIMSPKQIEAGEDACAQAPVGTGQYKFVEWVAGDHMKVELNKDWWGYDADVCGGTALADADAGFKSITFKPVAESATRVSAIQAGDAQIMWSVPTESVDTLKGDSNVSVGMGDSIAVWYFFMNTQKAPFNDVKVREAMAYAINKEAYIQVVMNGYGSVATSMVGEEVQHYKGNDPYSYDPEKAKELLKEAGADDDRVLAGTLHRMQRDSGKVERLQNVCITHLILQGDEQEILVFHRLLGFQAEQRNVLFTHHAVQIRPWGINSLAPHVLAFVEHIVQDLDAKVGHTDLIHIREQECAAQGYFLFVFYDTVEFISNVSRRLLNLEQHFFWQC